MQRKTELIEGNRQIIRKKYYFLRFPSEGETLNQKKIILDMKINFNCGIVH